MYTSIVVGIDGSPTAQIALERAIELAGEVGARLHVVSAYEPTPARVTGGQPAGEDYDLSPTFKVDAVLQRAMDRATDAGLEIQEHAPKGSPADALVETARQAGADLIVIGSVGMQGPKRIFGSVPNSVSHRSPCDLLIVQTQGR